MFVSAVDVSTTLLAVDELASPTVENGADSVDDTADKMYVFLSDLNDHLLEGGGMIGFESGAWIEACLKDLADGLFVLVVIKAITTKTF